jgi:hypothetical protein
MGQEELQKNKKCKMSGMKERRKCALPSNSAVFK